MSLQARSLASRGLRAVIVDLFGTGDSEGDFSEARWNVWCDNLKSLLSRTVEEGVGPVSFLAVRLGALLLFDRQSELVAHASRIVLWSPCISGTTFLRQFLRVRVASQISGAGGQKESVTDLLAAFKAGNSLEIAGYEVSSALAESMASAVLAAEDLDVAIPVHWFEVVSSPGSPLPAASRALIENLQGDHSELAATAICGDKFWNSVEITTIPALIDATTAVFAEASM